MNATFFYEHMGHSEAINRNIYQAPPAIMQLIKTGKQLQSIDEGKNKAKLLNFKLFYLTKSF